MENPRQPRSDDGLLLVALDALRDQMVVGELMDDHGEAAPDRELRDRQSGRDDDAQVTAEDDVARLDDAQPADDHGVRHEGGSIA